MLEDQDVTSSIEDMFEAIGPFLEQVDGSKTEDEIRLICDRLYALVVKKQVLMLNLKDICNDDDDDNDDDEQKENNIKYILIL